VSTLTGLGEVLGVLGLEVAMSLTVLPCFAAAAASCVDAVLQSCLGPLPLESSSSGVHLFRWRISKGRSCHATCRDLCSVRLAA